MQDVPSPCPLIKCCLLGIYGAYAIWLLWVLYETHTVLTAHKRLRIFFRNINSAMIFKTVHKQTGPNVGQRAQKPILSKQMYCKDSCCEHELCSHWTFKKELRKVIILYKALCHRRKIISMYLATRICLLATEIFHNLLFLSVTPHFCSFLEWPFLCLYSSSHVIYKKICSRLCIFLI